MLRSTMKRGLFAALAAVALGAMTPASAEPYKLRVSYDTIPTHLAPIIFKMPDQTKYFGKDYTIDFIRFKGSSLVLQALAADQVDVGRAGVLDLRHRHSSTPICRSRASPTWRRTDRASPPSMA